jgi:hypothetical protein
MVKDETFNGSTLNKKFTSYDDPTQISLVFLASFDTQIEFNNELILLGLLCRDFLTL